MYGSMQNIRFEVKIQNEKIENKFYHKTGTSLGERYACQLSLIVVALGAVGFIAEVFNALEYIKGEQA